MAGERFKMALVLVFMFFTLAIISTGLIAMQKIDVATLGQLYTQLGQMAAMFGIPGIITAWVALKGQTSEVQVQQILPENPKVVI